jgi:predicted PurR-regulated permease PerM
MRVVAIIVIILGLAAIVFGILFIPQASSAKQKVADSLTSGVTLDTLDATYDKIDQKLDSMKGNEADYLATFAQRTSLGLAKTNVGTAKAVQTNGIIDIVVGVALILSGFALLRRVQSTA